MAASHVKGTRAADDFPILGGPGGGVGLKAWGFYEIAAALEANSTIALCHLPKGALVLGCELLADDLDTGTEAMEIDIGTRTKGTSHGDSSESDQRFLDSGVVTGDTLADHSPGAKILVHGNKFSSGPIEMTVDTTVYANITAAANAGGTGTIGVIVDYVMP